VILGRMKHALLGLALSGCVTTAGLVNHDDVGLPLRIDSCGDWLATGLA
jgi:hypothetical protein